MTSPRPVAPATPAREERRERPRPRRPAAGFCAACGSAETLLVSPQNLFEWALERFGKAPLVRCHDCGERRAVAPLGLEVAYGWSFRRAAIRVVAWAAVAIGLSYMLFSFLRYGEQPGEAPRPRQQQPQGGPRQDRPNRREQAPSTQPPIGTPASPEAGGER